MAGGVTPARRFFPPSSNLTAQGFRAQRPQNSKALINVTVQRNLPGMLINRTLLLRSLRLQRLPQVPLDAARADAAKSLDKHHAKTFGLCSVAVLAICLVQRLLPCQRGFVATAARNSAPSTLIRLA
jgi:hypothetical protein